MILPPLYANNGKKVLQPFIKVYYCICASLITVQLSCFADVSTSQLPDTTKATVIDDLASLYVGDKVATPDYLFGTVVTNEMYDASGTNRIERYNHPYVERYRCFVDLDQDGHDDVLLSAPISQRGTGGLSFGVYLWTNGNYICIGEIGTHPGFLYVEQVNECTRAIWTYWHSSGSTGSIGTMRISGRHRAKEDHIYVDIGLDGQDLIPIGGLIYNTIREKATVPIRTETSVTTNGIVRWRSFNMKHEYR